MIQAGRFDAYESLSRLQRRDVFLAKAEDVRTTGTQRADDEASARDLEIHGIYNVSTCLLCQLAFLLLKVAVRKRRLSPRKMPRQDRSRATVEALLEATADILIRHGYAKLTTNRIADRAGVNIASLYQYFPGKEALVAELRRRHGDEQRAALRQALIERGGQGLESTIQALVSIGMAAHAAAPELHRVFADELPPIRYGDVSTRDAPLFDEMRRFLEAAGVARADMDLTLWMISTAAGAIVHRATIERPADLASGRITRELVRLLVRYLRRT
jgi:AcrR family transcriptional regulator